MDELRDFFRIIYGRIPEGLWLYLWTLADKCSHWFDDPWAAAAAATGLANEDVYVGVNLAARDWGPSRRCTRETVAAIPALACDWDVAGLAHKKLALPPTIEAALAIAPDEFPPTLVVGTGHGVHPWWALKEVEPVTDSNRDEVASVIEKWHRLAYLRATQRGYVIDNVSDLPRVLRVPGTRNTKVPGERCYAHIHQISGREYNFSEIREYLSDLRIAESPRATTVDAPKPEESGIVISPERSLDPKLLEAMCANDEVFAATWHHSRTTGIVDRTQSSWDMALANMGVQAGMSDQAIVDMLIQNRRVHGERPKLRYDYLVKSTIYKARQQFQKGAFVNSGGGVSPVSAAQPMITGAPVNGSGAFVPASTIEPLLLSPDNEALEKAAKCQHLSALLRIIIIRIVKIKGEDPTWCVETPRGMVTFDRARDYLSWREWEERICACTNFLIAKIKPAIWQNEIKPLLCEALVEEDGGAERDVNATWLNHVDEYLHTEGIYATINDAYAPDANGKQNYSSESGPFIRNGGIMLSSNALRGWLLHGKGEPYTLRETTNGLKRIGAEASLINIPGRKSHPSRWTLPAEAFALEDYLVKHA